MAEKTLEIDWEKFDELCEIFCPVEEIAQYFECTAQTLRRAVKKEKGLPFDKYYAMRVARGKILLREYQFKLAKSNATVAMKMGEEYLGQGKQASEDEAMQELKELFRNVR